MNYNSSISEEELKAKVREEYFAKFEYSIIGKIDFAISVKANKDDIPQYRNDFLLWAEAKKGKVDYVKSLIQLILTIGRARTFNAYNPPKYLAAFDSEKIVFIEYSAVSDIFFVNDFNWNVAPSNHETNEFKKLEERIKKDIEQNSMIFDYGKNLRSFIAQNFVPSGSEIAKIQIDKNNFMIVYNHWCETVKHSINTNWDTAKELLQIIDADFYLADLLSENNKSFKEKLNVVLEYNHYVFNKKTDEAGFFNTSNAYFIDGMKAHTQFWQCYERPPKEEYWDYIIDRRDLLVPQDVRERKGSFYTPRQWVELSQKYLAEVLGADWQDEYYVWDCAAGTGNLLAGLTNKYNIFASTLDQADVDVMKDRIDNGANLLESHVFQFDFLNDEFNKLPEKLQEIINDPEKRKKLVVYINPPYAEAGDSKQRTNTGKNKDGVSKKYSKYNDYLNEIGKAVYELYALFLLRIYKEVKPGYIGQFSTLKHLIAPNFDRFRNYFQPKLLKCFLVPADTFDNVKGQFPIGFHIWNCNEKQRFNGIQADVICEKHVEKKNIFCYDNDKGRIGKWLKTYDDKTNLKIGMMNSGRNDFQNQNLINIQFTISDKSHASTITITITNLIETCIYFAVRFCIAATWLNDRDQFLYPTDGWKEDFEFQTNCLIYTLFHGQNRISTKDDVNHWIPFTEAEVNSREKFASNFMSKYLRDWFAGKIDLKKSDEGLFSQAGVQEIAASAAKIKKSEPAEKVLAAGLALWKYYHAEPSGSINVNASLYDIKAHFQGTSNGRMNNKSDDAEYTRLLGNLRSALAELAEAIRPKVYEYGFLK